MQNKAQASERSGWLLTLDETACTTILRYADSRDLRKEMYLAFATRASDQVAGQSRYDNAPVLQALLRLRHEKAQLIGFSNFSELSLETKAAQSTAEVEAFLHTLIACDRPRLEREADQLRAFAKEQAAMICSHGTMSFTRRRFVSLKVPTLIKPSVSTFRMRRR